MRTSFIVLLLFVLLSACSSSKPVTEPVSIEQGRYLTVIGGCNDCHTPEWVKKPFQIPDSQWLTGDNLGFNGPWGTTYPTNLRKLASSMTEESWVALTKNLKTRPPMPWWILNAMTENDLKSMHRFLKSLGDAGEVEPAFLPPGEKPKTPVIEFFPKDL